ncbi:MAG: Cj0069 family protein [Candidatus Dormiibacterota bacterium]
MSHEPPRIGILWRGDRSAKPTAPDVSRGLNPLYAAFGQLSAVLHAVVFEDGAIDEVRDELLALDGVLVWVNPIQDGADRSNVDALLYEAASRGVWVSAHPDVILKLGTKEVLYSTRDVGWGSDIDVYRSPEEFARRFPAWLSARRLGVLKQGRGNGGNGVWKVELVDEHAPPDRDSFVRIQDARVRDGSTETTSLSTFMSRCDEYFAWSGCLVAQGFQNRLTDGMIRCYLSHDEVVGFCHQWPQALLDVEHVKHARASSPMVGADAPEYQRLRTKATTEWVPRMMEMLRVARDDLPVIWDADFLYGPRTPAGLDTYVLCEINVSAVWPFPPMAAGVIASAAVARTLEALERRRRT